MTRPATGETSMTGATPARTPGMRPKEGLFYGSVVAVVGLFLALSLPNLGALAFWNDEATTAVLAQSILRTGLPVCTLGRNDLCPNPADRNRFGVEANHGWLPHYLCALSFRAFGTSEWAGRFPFVLCGAATVLVAALLGRLLYGPLCGVLAGLLLAVQPTFIQYCRQCRYFSTAMLVFLLCVGAYHLVRVRRIHWFWLCAGFLLLYHSFQLYCAVLMATVFGIELAIRALRRDPRPNDDRFPLVRVACGSIALIGPWAVFFSVGRGATHATAGFDPAAVAAHLRTVFGTGFSFFPFLLPIGLVPLYPKRASCLPVLVGALSGLALSLVPEAVFTHTGGALLPRYYLFLLPVGALIAARAFALARFRATWLLVALAGALAIVPGAGAPIRAGVHDARAAWRRLVRIETFYRHPPSPDPERRDLAFVADLARPVPEVVVTGHYYYQTVFALGPGIAVLDPPELVRAPHGGLTISEPDARARLPLVRAPSDCRVHRCEGCGMQGLNTPERGVPTPPYDFSRLVLEVWDCPPPGSP